ncbi:hypothetical protein [Jannaschia rubra]|nr:hypothetical protein [Jannaschia rubra]
MTQAAHIPAAAPAIGDRVAMSVAVAPMDAVDTPPDRTARD